MSFWRTASGSEVDLILGEADVAIEINPARMWKAGPRGFTCSWKNKSAKKAFIVSREPLREADSQDHRPSWQVFCEMLWAGEII